MTYPSEPLLVTVNIAAALLSISTRSVRRLIESGEITPVKIGRSIRIPTSELTRLIDTRINHGNNAIARGNNQAVQETPQCQKAQTKTGCIVVPIRPFGGHPTPTAAAKELDALLAPAKKAKPPRSSENGKRKPTKKPTGTKNQNAPSRNS